LPPVDKPSADVSDQWLLHLPELHLPELPGPEQNRCGAYLDTGSTALEQHDRGSPTTGSASTFDLDDQLTIAQPAMPTVETGPTLHPAFQHQLSSRPLTVDEQHRAALPQSRGEHPQACWCSTEGRPRRWADGNQINTVGKHGKHLQHIRSGIRDQHNSVQVDAELGGRQQSDIGHADQRRPGIDRRRQQGEEQADRSGATAKAHHTAAGQPTSGQDFRERRRNGEYLMAGFRAGIGQNSTRGNLVPQVGEYPLTVGNRRIEHEFEHRTANYNVSTQCLKTSAPASPDFSGWNWVADSGPFSTAATKRSPPCSAQVSTGGRNGRLTSNFHSRTA